ncbi:MAG: DUF2807 domain-containing protein [Myxococcaceae bacterium]|nr:DUF2807 domain-containing protein [Myxococcaceae bacterium]
MNAKRALFLLLSLAVAGCDCASVPGSGVSKTEDRDVGLDYRRVQVGNGIKLTLTEGDPAKVKVTADDNIVPFIVTEVVEGSLIVKVRDDQPLAPSTDVNVEVSTKQLDWVSASGASEVTASGGLVCNILAIDTSGASKVTLDSAIGSSLWVHASGASEISIRKVSALVGNLDASGASKISFTEGNLDALDVKASGSSKVALIGVTSKTTTVDVSGASEIEVQASEKISGNASGASDIKVRGNPGSREVGVSGGSDVDFE